jgi:hypothetical protein
MKRAAPWHAPFCTVEVGEDASGPPVVGEANDDQAGSFPITCQKDAMGHQGIDPTARWMWYSPDGRLRGSKQQSLSTNATLATARS